MAAVSRWWWVWLGALTLNAASERADSVQYARKRRGAAPTAAGAGEGALSGETVARLVEEARRVADDTGAVTVVTAGYEYVDVLVNWLVAYEDTNGPNWVVVCLDERLKAFLEARKATCGATVPRAARDQGHGHIWATRVQLLTSLLTAGLNVTLADADAVAVGEIGPHLGVADVVASRGSFPNWATDLWGATGCMGFVRFNVGAARFARDLLAATRRLGDDQKALNAVFKRRDVRWVGAAPLGYVGSERTDFGRTESGATVALLPHSAFRRRCAPETSATKPVVLHCYADKVAGDKVAALRAAGAWMLRDDWKEIAPEYFTKTAAWLRSCKCRRDDTGGTVTTRSICPANLRSP